MHEARRLALIAAVNIDGSKFIGPTAKPSWRIDKRINPTTNADNELYRNNSLDKGHLVRRLDPVWGTQDEANAAVVDTYHYTNAAPQDHDFNDGVWGDVEDYILQLAGLKESKICVFTGPVIGKNDLEYGHQRPGGPWQIPSQFWKVIAYVKSDGTKAATGFVLDQSDDIADLMEGFTPLPKARQVARLHQRTIADIEKLTRLDFGEVKKFDPLAELEATKQTRRIVLPEQMVL